MASNKVQFGLSNVNLAFLTDEAAGTYDTPTAIPGAVKISLAPEGKSNEFYADDTKFWSADANTGYSGTLEAALLPDAVLAEMLGWDTDANGMLVEIADGAQKPFALLFDVDGDASGKRYVYYKCIAARPNDDHNTKSDTVTPDTATLSLTITPIELDGTVVVKASVEDTVATRSVFAAWYSSVTKPNFATVS